jgi:Uma2 family endonuclease
MSTAAVMTFAQFEHLPEAPGKRELIDGEVFQILPPLYRHTRIAKRLYDLLAGSAFGDRVLQEAGYRIGGGWLQPDVSVTQPNQALESDYLMGAPSLAIEILSPRNTAAEIERKLTLYFPEGADEVWVIAPGHRSFSAYRRVENHVQRVSVRDRYETAAFGIVVSLDTLFEA